MLQNEELKSQKLEASRKALEGDKNKLQGSLGEKESEIKASISQSSYDQSSVIWVIREEHCTLILFAF